MKKNIIGKFPYFGRLASFSLAAAAIFCMLIVIEKPPVFFLLSKLNFYKAWFFNTLIAYAVLRLIIWGTRWLDNYHPWQRSYRKRWPRQLLLAILVPLTMCIIGLLFYFEAYGKNIFDSNFFRRYLLLDTGAIFMFNGLLFFMHQQQANQRVRVQRAAVPAPALTFPMPIADIAYLYATQKYCFAVNFNGELEHLEFSLTKALAALPVQHFCLVRRSHIVNKSAIVAVQKKKGLRHLTLLANLKLTLLVSRKEIPAFDIWWETVV